MADAIARGLARQLAARRSEPAEDRLGWKVAFNAPAIQQRLGLAGSLVAGLSRRTLEPNAAPHSVRGARRIALEAEVAVRLRRGISADASLAEAADAVAAWAPAIEIVDFDRPFEELEEILAAGVFHRALRLGAFVPAPQGADLAGHVARVDHGAKRVCEVDARAATGDAADVLRHLATLLAPHGESLRSGDVVILGAMNPLTFAAAGDRFALDLGALGRVEVALAD